MGGVVISDRGSVCRLRVRVVGPGFRRAGCEANGFGERGWSWIFWVWMEAGRGLRGSRVGVRSPGSETGVGGGMEGGFGIAISWNGLGYVEEAAASLERGRT
jgi:hypothetical protein